MLERTASSWQRCYGHVGQPASEASRLISVRMWSPRRSGVDSQRIGDSAPFTVFTVQLGGRADDADWRIARRACGASHRDAGVELFRNVAVTRARTSCECRRHVFWTSNESKSRRSGGCSMPGEVGAKADFAGSRPSGINWEPPMFTHIILRYGYAMIFLAA